MGAETSSVAIVTVGRVTICWLIFMIFSQALPVFAEVAIEASGQELLSSAFFTQSPHSGGCFNTLSDPFPSAESPSMPGIEIANHWESTDPFAVGALHAGPPENLSGGRLENTDNPEVSAAKKQWTWRRASPAELAGITVGAAVTLYSETAWGDPKRASWTAHNGFDDSIRDALLLHDNKAREVAGNIGDGLMGLLIAEPIVDSFYTLGYRDRNWDALWQTSVINLESFTFTSLVSSVSQNAIKRQKPFVRICPDGSCADEQPNRGMPSGHVAFALTGAGLYCTHHEYQSLYDPATERALCVTSLGLAAADGVLRIMADRHYATDILAGSAIGLFSGFLLPRLLHYYWSENGTEPSRVQNKSEGSFFKRVSLSPQILSGGGSLTCDIKF